MMYECSHQDRWQAIPYHRVVYFPLSHWDESIYPQAKALICECHLWMWKAILYQRVIRFPSSLWDQCCSLWQRLCECPHRRCIRRSRSSELYYALCILRTREVLLVLDGFFPFVTLGGTLEALGPCGLGWGLP
ncbi:hypothetical protein Tco_0002911 [Tanacetum coccineum]